MPFSLKAMFTADEWFKTMIVLASVFLFISLTVNLHADNGLVALISLTVLFWSLGEMAYRPYRQALDLSQQGRVVGKYSGRPRVLNGSGLALQVISITWSIFAVIRAIHLYWPW
ncbi:hypothetical protein R84981_000960 [Carnimonas sp. R-84981]|uniref:hypothetical protein n=1 Tax=Carnimonas bestiolae TaxID=3402172 RepID=UPI003EDC5479